MERKGDDKNHGQIRRSQPFDPNARSSAEIMSPIITTIISPPAGIRTRGHEHCLNIHLRSRLAETCFQCLSLKLCDFRSPTPLRDSPGFTPGSLLTQPQHLVIEPELRHKIDHEN